MVSPHLSVRLSEANSPDFDLCTLFRNLILALAEGEPGAVSTSASAVNKPFCGLPPAEMRNYLSDEPLMRWLASSFERGRLGFPALYRRKLGPRLDLSDATTYAEAARIVLRSMGASEIRDCA
jgi:hypothetical protein